MYPLFHPTSSIVDGVGISRQCSCAFRRYRRFLFGEIFRKTPCQNLGPRNPGCLVGWFKVRRGGGIGSVQLFSLCLPVVLSPLTNIYNLIALLKLFRCWWMMIRLEIRGHAKALRCSSVLGYRETCTIVNDCCILTAMGTAAMVRRPKRNHRNNHRNNHCDNHHNNHYHNPFCTNSSTSPHLIEIKKKVHLWIV